MLRLKIDEETVQEGERQQVLQMKELVAEVQQKKEMVEARARDKQA